MKRIAIVALLAAFVLLATPFMIMPVVAEETDSPVPESGDGAIFYLDDGGGYVLLSPGRLWTGSADVGEPPEPESPGRLWVGSMNPGEPQPESPGRLWVGSSGDGSVEPLSPGRMWVGSLIVDGDNVIFLPNQIWVGS